MSRYIDADKLLNPDNIIVMQDETGIDEFPYTYTNAVKVETILSATTADVVEIRHGEWVVCGAFDDFLKCSLCHSDYPWMQVSHHNFCPNCGAKMDGERRANDGT